MTIPAVTRFDDFRIALWNLSDGSKVVLNPESLLDLQFETVPGVGGDRLKSATFQMPWYANARAAFDFDALQLVQIDRYSDPATTLWGIVLKPKEGYSGRVGRDAIQVQVVQVEEFLKSRKVHYSEEDGGGAIHAANVYPDDFAKLMVRSCFSGTDVDGNARGWGWGSLVVEADTSQCAELASFSYLSGDDEDDTLYKHVDGMARTYDFDYQLKVTVTAGAFTFTFVTQAPYGGSDLTAGANRVMIKDLYNLVPSATRYRDAAMRATAIYTRGYADVLLDADAITTWGRWEGVARGVLLADAEVALEKARVKEGAEYGFEATGANGMVRWLEDFKAGDKVLRINNRLGIAGDSEKIAAVIGRFQNKVLQLTIRWGDREPAMTDKQSGGGNAGGGGDGSVPIVAKPVATASSTGVDPHAYVYGDHEHKSGLKDTVGAFAGADVDGAVKLESLHASLVITAAPASNKLTLNLTGVAGAAFAAPTITFGAAHVEGAATSTIRSDATIKLVFAGSTGTAVPAANNTITFVGAGSVSTSATGNTVTITGATCLWTMADGIIKPADNYVIRNYDGTFEVGTTGTIVIAAAAMLQFGGNTRYVAYVSGEGATYLRDPTVVGLAVGANTRAYLSTAEFYPVGTLNLGKSANKWAALWLSGDANIKGLTYTWPTAHAAGVLKNNGSGTLTWGGSHRHTISVSFEGPTGTAAGHTHDMSHSHSGDTGYATP